MLINAVIKTDKGNIKITLFADKVPYTAANFVNLSMKGFYNGLKFHRVIEDFMVQAGCPNGIGNGGPGYKFKDEFVAELKHDKPGILSMANAGPNTNGSQFFITHVPTAWLNGKHTVFGSVVDSEDISVVNSIKQGDKILSIDIEGDTEELFAKAADKLTEWNSILKI